jgi:hypothetical protein
VTDDLPQDPFEDVQHGASQLHTLYTALVNGGFSQAEALELVKAVIQGQMK